MAEIVAHEALNALPRRLPRVSQNLRGTFLQLMAEDVVIALALEMQDRPDAQQKFFGIFERAGPGAALREQGRVGEHGDGLRPKQITQAAG